MAVWQVLLYVLAVCLLVFLVLVMYKRFGVEKNQALLNAVRKDRTVKLKKLIADGANVNAVDSEKRTALIIATMQGKIGIVRILLENGADVILTDNSGQTALDYAKVLRNEALLRLLKKHGAI